MSRSGLVAAVVVSNLFMGCSNTPRSPLAEGFTSTLKERVIARSIQEIESIENFKPENFERLQRKHFESMTQDMKTQALAHLQSRSSWVCPLCPLLV